MSNMKIGLIAQLLFLVAFCAVSESAAQQSNFIWSPQSDAVEPSGGVFYRKRFTLGNPEQAELHLSAGDEYDIYINGVQVLQGQSYGAPTQLDVSDFLEPGINTLAAKVRHLEGQDIGLAVRLRVREENEARFRSLVSDQSWKTYIREVEGWQDPRFNDYTWLPATIISHADILDLGRIKAGTNAGAGQVQAGSGLKNEATAQSQQINEVSPSPTGTTDQFETRNAQQVAGSQGSGAQGSGTQPIASQGSGTQQIANLGGISQGTAIKDSRFEVDPEFVVEQILTPEEAGSVIAMEFDEFGRLLIAREGDGLYRIDLSLPRGDAGRIFQCCTEVTNIQGILPLNGRVYVTGQGRDGQGLYLLAPNKADGKLNVSKSLLRFRGEPSEHGAHGLRLGPDGFIYVTLGNESSLINQTASTSPYQHPYEGDVVARYEDPNGQSVGVEAPGGTIVRTNLKGTIVETVAGGLRNAYDMVFNTDGQLFFHDSDMETDRGASWYRPNTIYSLTAGGDYGWRSGWAKFPQHFVDQVPGIVETGRGSPTGAVLYQHHNFPIRFHNSMFFADWTEGTILSVKVSPSGAGYVGQAKTFLKGKPLNVSDLAISPQGSLCFSTGGRATEGGVFRVRWTGTVPPEMTQYESGLAQAIRHPQPNSAWGRQQIAKLQREIGPSWSRDIKGVALEVENPVDYRTRAVHLMLLHGPTPNTAMLRSLARDEDSEIRALAARVCGTVRDTNAVIRELVTDGNAMVRRCAVESAMRKEMTLPLETILPMLRSFDRIEATVARRMLERLPASRWHETVHTTDDVRVFIQGSMAMSISSPNLEDSYKILARASKFMDGFVNDADFVDLLRTSQLALIRGEVDPDKIPAFAKRMADEFPSGNSTINRELIRVLAYLKENNLEGRLEEYLSTSETSSVDKFHAAMLMQTLGSKLDSNSRLQIIATLEALKQGELMPETDAYIRRAIRDVASTVTIEQIPTILENGSRWPDAMLATLFVLPAKPNSRMLARLREIDQALIDREGEDIEQLRSCIIAVLAENSDALSMEYLRGLWEREPERRNEISLGLAQRPNEENWSYLVSSIRELDDQTGAEVLDKLTVVQRRPRQASHYRDVIELGYRLREPGIDATHQLLRHWSGKESSTDGQSWEEILNGWNRWYQTEFPTADPIDIPAANIDDQSSMNVDSLLRRLENAPQGDAMAGQHVYAAANCAICHHCSGIGQSGGPELTKSGNRYSDREILEAIVSPDKFVADRYRSSRILLADGRVIEGMTSKEGVDQINVLLKTGKKLKYAANQVQEIQPLTTSPMPAGLIDGLDNQQLANLVAFIRG